MQRYIISYDLYRPSNNYSEFTARIKRLGPDWEHPLANLWIVETKLLADEIRHILGDYLTPGDKLYICETGGDEAAMDLAPLAHCSVAAASNKRPSGRLLAKVLTHPAARRESRLLMAATG